MTIDEAIIALERIAAEMYRGDDMPPWIIHDLYLPKTTPLKARKIINAELMLVRETSRRHAKMICNVVDGLRKG